MSEHVDLLVVGAGLSGIGAASHLRAAFPERSLAILEARAAIGGTWDLFRYPGIRSDSDMFTLGYAFRPWTEGRAIADGPSILAYIRETARERGVEGLVRFGHRVTRAAWSSETARWTVRAERPDGEAVTLTCDFLYACTGYYRYDAGHAPELPGQERFGGRLVHPQHWPEDLDWAGRRIVVVGSGATAVTLVPALAERAAHVTMLQRSPSYVLSLPNEDPLARLVRRHLPAQTAGRVLRWMNALLAQLMYAVSRRRPRLVARLLRRGVERLLPPEIPVDPHFTPRYDPWDQRLCIVPDGDLFRALRQGTASVVTDRIETFNETGLRLASGGELEADVVVTATGLELLVLGGMTLAVDGHEVALPETVGYKGLMLGGVPNLAIALGYTNASWTLKADLVSAYVVRLLRHMDAHGHRIAVPRAPAPGTPTDPFLDLRSGYVMRALDRLPRQGPRPPWRLHQNYLRDVLLLRRGPVDDEMDFPAPHRFSESSRAGPSPLVHSSSSPGHG